MQNLVQKSVLCNAYFLIMQAISVCLFISESALGCHLHYRHKAVHLKNEGLSYAH
jgi:hypothetical protein